MSYFKFSYLFCFFRVSVLFTEGEVDREHVMMLMLAAKLLLTDNELFEVFVYIRRSLADITFLTFSADKRTFNS